MAIARPTTTGQMPRRRCSGSRRAHRPDRRATAAVPVCRRERVRLGREVLAERLGRRAARSAYLGTTVIWPALPPLLEVDREGRLVAVGRRGARRPPRGRSIRSRTAPATAPETLEVLRRRQARRGTSPRRTPSGPAHPRARRPSARARREPAGELRRRRLSSWPRPAVELAGAVMQLREPVRELAAAAGELADAVGELRVAALQPGDAGAEVASAAVVQVAEAGRELLDLGGERGRRAGRVWSDCCTPPSGRATAPDGLPRRRELRPQLLVGRIVLAGGHRAERRERRVELRVDACAAVPRRH